MLVKTIRAKKPFEIATRLDSHFFLEGEVAKIKFSNEKELKGHLVSGFFEVVPDGTVSTLVQIPVVYAEVPVVQTEVPVQPEVPALPDFPQESDFVVENKQDKITPSDPDVDQPTTDQVKPDVIVPDKNKPTPKKAKGKGGRKNNEW